MDTGKKARACANEESYTDGRELRNDSGTSVGRDTFPKAEDAIPPGLRESILKHCSAMGGTVPSGPWPLDEQKHVLSFEGGRC